MEWIAFLFEYLLRRLIEVWWFFILWISIKLNYSLFKRSRKWSFSCWNIFLYTYRPYIASIVYISDTHWTEYTWQVFFIQCFQAALYNGHNEIIVNIFTPKYDLRAMMYPINGTRHTQLKTLNSQKTPHNEQAMGCLLWICLISTTLRYQEFTISVVVYKAYTLVMH